MPAAFLTQKDKNKSKNEQERIYVVKEERAILQEYTTQKQTTILYVFAHQGNERKRCTER
jgi:hypothetical protein